MHGAPCDCRAEAAVCGAASVGHHTDVKGRWEDRWEGLHSRSTHRVLSGQASVKHPVTFTKSLYVEWGEVIISFI